MSANIILEGYDDESHKELQTGLYDMHNSNDTSTVLMVFGNGCYDEVRIKGETKEAIMLFVALLNNGGYFLNLGNTSARSLYVAGFGCFPEVDPFIFVDPNALNGEQYEMRNVHSPEIMKYRKPWWKIW